MKKTMTVAAIAALGTIAAPMASATFDPNNPWHWDHVSKSAHLESQVSDYWNGGWCDHGQPASAYALRTTDGTTKTVYLDDWGLVQKGDDNKLVNQRRTVKVTPRGVVIPVPWPAAGKSIYGSVESRVSFSPDDVSGVMDLSAINPESCKGLPNHIPGLPKTWEGPTKPAPTPTKPVPKPTTPVPTRTTKPAPKPAKPRPTHPTVPTTSGHTTTASAPGKPRQTARPAPVTSAAMPTHTTTMPPQATHPGVGPKVDTDWVSSSDHATGLAVGGAIGALALLGGGTVVARRRR